MTAAHSGQVYKGQLEGKNARVALVQLEGDELLADREFMGKDWFAALEQRRLRRCIRIREDSMLDDLAVRDAFANLLPGEVRGLLEREVVYDAEMQVVATLSSEGERVVIASDLSLFHTYEGLT